MYSYDEIYRPLHTTNYISWVSLVLKKNKKRTIGKRIPYIYVV